MGGTLVIGTGQLGTALLREGRGELHALDRAALDLEDLDAIEPALAAARPAVVINAAAYNAVDAAERSPDRAFAVNATAPGRLARAAAAQGARFVHVSTDYVFGGDAARPYREEDLPAPLGVYGASKLAGEHLVRAYAPDALVVRTSVVFGARPGGKRSYFVHTILTQAREGRALRVVDDQVGGPTYAPDLARAILALVDRGVSGIVHVSNAGSCSRYEFARAILDAAGLDAQITPVAGSARPDIARRPRYSVLDCSRLTGLGITMPHWHDALGRYLAEEDAPIASVAGRRGEAGG